MRNNYWIHYSWLSEIKRMGVTSFPTRVLFFINSSNHNTLQQFYLSIMRSLLETIQFLIPECINEAVSDCKRFFAMSANESNFLGSLVGTIHDRDELDNKFQELALEKAE